MKTLFSFFLLLTALHTLPAQPLPPSEAQERVWLGRDTTNGASHGFRIMVDAQSRAYTLVNGGGTVIAGQDRQLIAWDGQGRVRWKHLYGPAEAIYLADGDFSPDQAIVAGGFDAREGRSFLTKVDTEGDLLWQAWLPVEYNVWDLAVAATGDTYITGWYQVPGRLLTGLLRYSPEGELRWADFFPKDDSSINICYAKNLALSPDESLLGVGCFWGKFNGTMVMQFDTSGNLRWRQYVEVPSDSLLRVYVNDLVLDQEGSSYLALYVDSATNHAPKVTYDGSVDGRLVKLDPSGQQVWYRDYAPPALRANLYKLALAPDDDLIVTGNILGPPTYRVDRLGYLARFGPTGDMRWEKTFGSLNSGWHAFHDLEVDDEGFIYPAGTGNCCIYEYFNDKPEHCCTVGELNDSRWEWLIFKINPYGEEVWRMNEGGRGSWEFRDWLYDIKLGPEGDIFATGFLLQRPLSRPGTFGTGPVWSTAAAGRYTNPGETRPLSLEVFPNPAYEQVTFQVGLPEETEAEVSLYDLAGRHIITLQQTWPAGRQRLSWRPQNLAAGLYLYRVRLGSQHYSGKLVWRGGS